MKNKNSAMNAKLTDAKAKRTAEILNMAGVEIRDCIKMAIGNILMPQWNDEDLEHYMFRRSVKTKEAPMGHYYDEAEFTPVLRIVDHIVIDERNQTDNYCWDKEMVAKYIDKAVPIGSNSAMGMLTASEVICSIRKREEKLKLSRFFSKYNDDCLYIDTPEEQRKCIVVTQELYDAGLTWCIDQWVKPDENGEYEITELEVGDVLIVDTGVYCCRKNVFSKTYKF